MPDIQKYVDVAKNLEFCDDFGKEPVLLARVTKDASTIAVISLLGGFVAMAATGFPGLVAVAFAALNDISYARSHDDDDDTKSPTVINEVAIDVESSPVEAQTQQGIQPSNDQDGQTEKLGIGSKNWEFLSRDNPNCRQAIEVVPIATTAAAAPSFTSPNLTPPSSRSELIARLKQDCPLLLKLVKSHPIRAVGVQQSGKTTLVKRLALLRMVLLENHSVTASTPHYELANPYPDVFEVAGIRNGQRDYPAIERAWSKMASDVESCQMGNVTYIWDEFGLIDKAIPISPENDPIKAVLTSCLRETMKFQIYPIFILHGETIAFLPGSKGLVTVIMASTVRVEAIGEPVEGDDGLEMIRPTGRFNVTWLDGSKGEGILPAWLSEDFLIGMIGHRTVIKEQPIAPPSSTAIADISNTWREDFAKSLPPNLSESEFKQRYELERMLRESSSLESPITSWDGGTDDDIDPAIELINAEPIAAKRDALMIAYLWAQTKISKGEEVSRSAFLERARKERKNEYLVTNRDEVWDDLQALID